MSCGALGWGRGGSRRVPCPQPPRGRERLWVTGPRQEAEKGEGEGKRQEAGKGQGWGLGGKGALKRAREGIFERQDSRTREGVGDTQQQEAPGKRQRTQGPQGPSMQRQDSRKHEGGIQRQEGGGDRAREGATATLERQTSDRSRSGQGKGAPEVAAGRPRDSMPRDRDRSGGAVQARGKGPEAGRRMRLRACTQRVQESEGVEEEGEGGPMTGSSIKRSTPTCLYHRPRHSPRHSPSPTVPLTRPKAPFTRAPKLPGQGDQTRSATLLRLCRNQGAQVGAMHLRNAVSKGARPLAELPPLCPQRKQGTGLQDLDWGPPAKAPAPPARHTSGAPGTAGARPKTAGGSAARDARHPRVQRPRERATAGLHQARAAAGLGQGTAPGARA